MKDVRPLGYMLGRSLRIFLSQVENEFRNRKIELTFDQYVMLRMIDSDCNLIQQDIANHLQKDKSIVVRQMNGLIEKEYVVRTTNRKDKRKKNLILTPKGNEIMNKIGKLTIEVSDKLLSGVNKNDYEVFLVVLDQIRKNGGINED